MSIASTLASLKEATYADYELRPATRLDDEPSIPAYICALDLQPKRLGFGIDSCDALAKLKALAEAHERAAFFEALEYRSALWDSNVPLLPELQSEAYCLDALENEYGWTLTESLSGSTYFAPLTLFTNDPAKRKLPKKLSVTYGAALGVVGEIDASSAAVLEAQERTIIDHSFRRRFLWKKVNPLEFLSCSIVSEIERCSLDLFSFRCPGPRDLHIVMTFCVARDGAFALTAGASASGTLSASVTKSVLESLQSRSSRRLYCRANPSALAIEKPSSPLERACFWGNPRNLGLLNLNDPHGCNLTERDMPPERRSYLLDAKTFDASGVEFSIKYAFQFSVISGGETNTLPTPFN